MHQEAFELHLLLEAQKLSGPIILVGQSIGGLLARIYTKEYGSNVVGIVLVDPTHESSMLGSLRYGGWVRLREKATARPVPEPKREGAPAKDQKPEDDFSAEEFQQIYMDRKGNPQPLGDRPLVVLGAGKRGKPPGTSDEMWDQLKKEREENIKDLQSLSRNSKLVIVPSSGHAIHVEDPQAVVKAIEEVIESVRTGGPLKR
jgi:pimeloyl-ACP methyl ester carboxylesterase